MHSGPGPQDPARGPRMHNGKVMADSERVFRDAGIATWRWDPGAAVLQLSDDGRAMLQVRDDELPLRLDTVLAHLVDEDIAAFSSAFERMQLQPGVHCADFRARLDDGAVRWYRALGRAFHDDAGRLTHAAGVLLEVTELRCAQQQLAEAAAAFGSSGEGIVITDERGTIRDVNRAFISITGYRREEAVGRNARLLRSRRHGAGVYRQLRESLRRDGQWRGELWNRRKDGEVFPHMVTVTRIDDARSGYVAVFTDISRLKDNERQLERLAHYDRLTQLPNRALIVQQLQVALQRAQQRGSGLAVIFMDVDSFKAVNDSLGHVAGDRLLSVAARRLRAALRHEDRVGRIGGDEFLLVIEDLESPQQAARVAEQVIDALRAPVAINGRELTVTASLGISLYPQDGADTEALMSHADAAMYSAKEQGRDTFRFYSQRMTEHAFQHLLLDSALREAQQRGELHLTFQPQVALADKRLTGLEVLLRWHHPVLGIMPPTRFIPHAERTGLIRAIGEWALTAACGQGARWLAAGIDFGTLAVNVSAPQFRDPRFVPTVLRILRETGLPADRLELEITESVLLRDTEELLLHMSQLREAGVRFAIDDFGTGYSSLAYLRRMPIDRLKLDRSFVTELVSDDNARIIAGAVIALGRALGIRVLAEGVEDEAQEILLARLGCTEAQGYRFSMPLFAEKIETILHARQLPRALPHAAGSGPLRRLPD